MAGVDRILVSTEEMEAAIQKYEGAHTTLQEAYGKMDAAREHLDRCYKGPGYVALSLKLADIYANVRTADRAIDETISGLRTTINEMNQGEQTVQSNTNALEVGKNAPVYL